ncbi:fimbrial protein [Serratia marcescens]|uniref:fimbrial protein n=1 Tax=Serratia marcescens TaxID=615 RepID=UPI000B6AC041|nr:fimbrial protein [Serratia marcescens]MBH3072756.1 fimbrial protein [Serratia marcescens]OUI68983.1 hypothetical protein AZZ99_003274 [Serratia marcescens]HEJ0329748.1 fimbrial protein [Serratia marcescens]
MKMKKRLFYSLAVVTVFVSWIAYMNDASANTSGTLTYSGRLLKSSPCVFLNNDPTNVDFGDVQVRDLNTNAEKYQKFISLPMRCKASSTQVGVRHLGTASSFNNAAVISDIDGLGIELRLLAANGDMRPFIVGGRLIYPTRVEEAGADYDINMILSALPSKDPNNQPKVGAFHATSTIQLEYP